MQAFHTLGPKCLGSGNRSLLIYAKFSVNCTAMNSTRDDVYRRNAPDPEFCYPAGSESDPRSHLDPLQTSPIIFSTTADNRRKIDPTAPEGNWNDCLPCFVTELLLE